MKAITTKFLGCTRHLGSRIVATDGDGNRAVVSYDHALNSDRNHQRAAAALCTKMGWHGRLVTGELRGGVQAHVWQSPSRRASFWVKPLGRKFVVGAYGSGKRH